MSIKSDHSGNEIGVHDPRPEAYYALWHSVDVDAEQETVATISEPKMIPFPQFSTFVGRWVSWETGISKGCAARVSCGIPGR